MTIRFTRRAAILGALATTSMAAGCGLPRPGPNKKEIFAGSVLVFVLCLGFCGLGCDLRVDIRGLAAPERVEHLTCPVVRDGAIADASDQRTERASRHRAGSDLQPVGIQPPRQLAHHPVGDQLR